ncbi:MAG: hypothetical protein LUD72_06320 [Bacteroidales bacterium]|nr:hypothetical protein [Bacteroidales bacterium]
MKGTIYIPYANGDCEKGFKYEGEKITKERYADIMKKEYSSHKGGIDEMMEYQWGNNIAINPYQKEKRKYTQQTYFFHSCPCKFFDIEGNDFELSELDRLYRNKEKFIIIIHLDPSTVRSRADLETDWRAWIQDSLKVQNHEELSDEEVLKHSPKKDFKLYIEEDKSSAVLKDCTFAERLNPKSNLNVAVIVERIVFIK